MNTDFLHNSAVLGTMRDPWRQRDDTNDVPAKVEDSKDNGQQFQSSVLDTAQLLSLLLGQINKVGVAS